MEKDEEEINEEESEFEPYMGIFLIGLLIGAMIMSFIFIVFAIDTPINQLELSEDKIAEAYVLEYYPEYSNCSIEWDKNLVSDCSTCAWKSGVNIYCDSMDNRDGLRIRKEYQPTQQIEFDDVSIQDALEHLLSEYK